MFAPRERKGPAASADAGQRGDADRGDAATGLVGRHAEETRRDDARKPGVTAAMYLYTHAGKFLQMVAERVAAIEPLLPRGLTWNDYARFARQFLHAFAAQVDGFDLSRAAALRELVHPADAYAAVDSGRIMLGVDEEGAARHPGDPRYGFLGMRDWSEAAGRAFAHVVESTLRQSLTRMAARYLGVAQHKGWNGGTPDEAWAASAAEELVASHPIDRLVAPALTTYGAVDVAAVPRTTAAPGDKTPRTKNGLRRLDLTTFVWQGAKDPTLWNWIRVPAPDATAEEVAEAIWGSGDGDAAYRAYAITAMPPYFGLPRGWARKQPGAAEHAPRSADEGSPTADAVAFSRSALSEEAALIQVGSDDKRETPPSADEIGALLYQLTAQLAHILPIAEAWGEGEKLDGVRAFVAGKARMFDEDPGRVRIWGRALRHQQQVLYEVATQLSQLHAQLGAMGKIDPHEAGAAPYRELVAAYVEAAATSHLPAAGGPLLAGARERQRMLVARVMVDAARTAELSVQDMRGVVADTDADRRRFTRQSGDLTDGAAKLQGDLLAGKAPDPDHVDEMLVTADEVALKARLRALGARLALVETQAAKVNDSWTEHVANAFHDDIWTIPAKAGELKARLETIRAHLEESTAHARLMALGDSNEQKMTREGRRAAVARARAAFDAIQKDTNVEKFLRSAYSEIKDAQLRAVILQVGILIGLSLVSAGMGGAATSVARGFLAARSAQTVAVTVGLSRTAMVATRALGLGLESALNTAGQVAVLDKPVGATFLEDFLGNLATSGILHGLSGGAQVAEGVDDAVRAMWKQSAGRLVIAKGLQLTGETLVGAATSYVVSRALAAGHPLEPQTVSAWYLQGAAIAVGRFVHGAAAKQMQRLQSLAAVKGWKLGRSLSDEVRALRAAAVRLEAQPSHEAALALLHQQGALLRKEQWTLEDVARNPVLAKQLDGALDRLQKENAAALAEHAGPGTRRLLLQGAGLRPTIGDHTWTGTAEEVAAAVKNANDAGVAAGVKSTDGGTHVLEIGGAEIRVNIRGAARRRWGRARARGADAGEEGTDARGSRLPEYPIRIGDIEVFPDNPNNTFFFTIKFLGTTAAGKKIDLGDASVMLSNGVPSDSPAMNLKARTYVDGQEYAVKIHEDVRAVPGSQIPAAVGKRTPLTAFALHHFLARYKERFGRKPKELFGYLVDSNRLHFQQEYVKARQKMDHEAALKAAIEKISFGEHRIAEGYSDLRVDPDTRFEQVDLGPGFGFHTVPIMINVTAREK